MGTYLLCDGYSSCSYISWIYRLKDASPVVRRSRYMKVLLYVLLGFVFIGVGVVWYASSHDFDSVTSVEEVLLSEEPVHDPVAEEVRITDAEQQLRVFDSVGNEIYQLTIHDLNEWVSEYWDDVFAVRPSFGEIREVNTEFSRFDQVAAVVPERNEVLFVVSDYAAATTLSFVGILNLNSEQIHIPPFTNNGGISSIYVSPEGEYVAYSLDTARAQGDGLVLVDMVNQERIQEFNGVDIISTLTTDENVASNEYLPQFTVIGWIQNHTLEFSTVDPREQSERVQWRFNIQTEILEQI